MRRGGRREVWGHWEARSGKGVVAYVRPRAFTLGGREPLQGLEGGQLWAVSTRLAPLPRWK